MTEYEYYSVWKNPPNMNTNIIRFGKITRIRIQILVFGLNYSNNIQIPNYLLTSVIHGVHHDIVHGVPHTNIIRFWKITWIWIRILVFGLNYSNTKLFAHLCSQCPPTHHYLQKYHQSPESLLQNLMLKMEVGQQGRHHICQTFYTSRLLTKKKLPESA